MKSFAYKLLHYLSTTQDLGSYVIKAYYEYLKNGPRYKLVSSLFYINESLVLAVKNYAKNDIEVVWSYLVCFFKNIS